MEENINIAEILKDKPVGLKLYSPTFGCIRFNGVYKDKVYFYSEDTNAHSVNQYGKMYDGGECIIFPSKEMRDWSKFAWKKGDVLIRTNSEYCIGIFDEWTSDDYSTFSAKYINLGLSDNFSCSYTCKTEEWKKTENSKNYISEIERVMNGKLNLQTLEIQTQPEFKDGDIVLVESDMIGINTGAMIAIFRKEKEIDKYKFSPALCESIEHDTYLREDSVVLSPSDIQIFRPATDSEKQQLFDVLEKKGKAWDAEKKQVVDVKPKWTPKPFDRVITRNDDDDIWTANIFSHMNSYGEYVAIGCIGGYHYCLPYNDETAHLIGTTDEWKGGEG